VERGGTDAVLTQLRALTEPDDGGATISGGSALPSLPPATVVKDSKPAPTDKVTYQNRVAPFVQNSANFTAQATISADRRYVRLSLTPNFNVVGGTQLQPVVGVFNPALPGKFP
jgi:hypothetical protein